MKTKIKSWLTVFFSVTASIFICEPVQAQDEYRAAGSQRAAVEGSGGGYTGPSTAGIAIIRQQQAEQQARYDAAIAQNNQGNDAYNKKDWATAITDYTVALQNNPYDQVIRNNLADAQKQLKAQQDNKIAANNMQQIVRNFAQDLNNSTAPSSGLDFDGGGGSAGSGGKSGGLDFMSADSSAKPELHDAVAGSQPKPALEFGDPMVVDARNVPTGLPKDVDKAIADAYANAPAGVAERVRKGFQAVTVHDWKLAKAYFLDAANHDPSNPELRRLAEITDKTINPSPDSSKVDQSKDTSARKQMEVNSYQDAIMDNAAQQLKDDPSDENLEHYIFIQAMLKN